MPPTLTPSQPLCGLGIMYMYVLNYSSSHLGRLPVIHSYTFAAANNKKPKAAIAKKLHSNTSYISIIIEV